MSTKTTETLEQRAARLAEEMREVNEEQTRLANEAAQRRAQAQADFDAKIVADWNAADLDAAVTDAQRALRQAIADDPLTIAVSNYYIAAGLRHERWNQYLGARTRQGLNNTNMQAPTIPELAPVSELIGKAGQNNGYDARTAAAIEHDTARNDTTED